MKFSFALPLAALATVVLSAPAMAAPVEAPAIRARACDKSNNIVVLVEDILEGVVPALKPLLDGVNGLEDALGESIPAVGLLLDTLNALCL